MGNYFKKYLNPPDRSEAIQLAVEHLKGIPFEAIAVTGYSGSTFGSVVAHILHKPIILVRKEKELQNWTSHCSDRVTFGGDLVPASYVLIDDFVCSGNTLRVTVKAIKEAAPGTQCVGFYTYDWKGDNLHLARHACMCENVPFIGPPEPAKVQPPGLPALPPDPLDNTLRPASPTVTPELWKAACAGLDMGVMNNPDLGKTRSLRGINSEMLAECYGMKPPVMFPAYTALTPPKS